MPETPQLYLGVESTRIIEGLSSQFTESLEG